VFLFVLVSAKLLKNNRFIMIKGFWKDEACFFMLQITFIKKCKYNHVSYFILLMKTFSEIVGILKNNFADDMQTDRQT